MFKYETHMHTFPVSRCGKASIRESLEFYKSRGYDGVFVTNHFLDGNINIDKSLPYREKIEFFCSDYEEGVRIAPEIGIKVFFGVEMGYHGSDFLVYGLDKAWYLEHPEIMEMGKSTELPFLRENGAFVAHAHPFREANYIDHIRLFPRCVDAVEVINASRTELENRMANIYADNYELLKIAGSDNHRAGLATALAGVEFETPINDERDFIRLIREGKGKIFHEELPEPAAN